MDTSALLDWLALHLLHGLGPGTARKALEHYQDPGEIAYRLPVERLRRFGRIAGDRILESRAKLADAAERELRLARDRDVRIVPLVDPGFPAALIETPDPPLLLYQRGELPPGVLRVAVVGSRTPTVYGRRVAAGLASGLAVRGVEVVSGGARGVDRQAHRAALDSEGRTVAVLGSGLLRPYPEEHGQLFEEIAASGAVLSELPLEEPPRGPQFPRRNRLISGLSAAAVVVEAADRSGALITAREAAEQGREVLAVPGPVDSVKSVGCHRLIQEGAKLIQNIEDILDELPPLYRRGVVDPDLDAEGPDLTGISEDERRVLGMLEDAGTVHLDHLADLVPFGIARLQTALFGLESRGAVEQCPGKYYVLRPKKEP